MSPGTEELVGSSSTHVQEVVKAAEEDLRQLTRQRADIVKPIREELWELVGRKDRARQRGLTKSCRTGVDGG